jgi:hypothetical protein
MQIKTKIYEPINLDRERAWMGCTNCHFFNKTAQMCIHPNDYRMLFGQLDCANQFPVSPVETDVEGERCDY